MAEADVIPIEHATSRGNHPQRCRATTSSGRGCRNHAVTPSGYCRVHADRAPAAETEQAADAQAPDELLARLETFVRRRLAGEYEIDDFGYDRELSRDILLPLFRPLVERYFRVRTLGIDRIPSVGGALVVANHSGTVALDALVLQAVIALEHPQERPLRNVGANLVYRLPVVGPMARKIGNAVACDEDALELLRRGELVGVFPEGYKGVGKGWRERYRLQRFGRGGFIEIALRAGVPIIPVAIVGAEEAYPMLGNAKLLARALGFPYFPITPTFPWLGPLGAIPLPSRWVIEFGDPVTFEDYGPEAAEDKMLVFDLADDVRDRIQQMLYKNLKFRGGIFF